MNNYGRESLAGGMWGELGWGCVGRAWLGVCVEGDFPSGQFETKASFLCQATSPLSSKLFSALSVLRQAIVFLFGN